MTVLAGEKRENEKYRGFAANLSHMRGDEMKYYQKPLK